MIYLSYFLGNIVIMRARAARLAECQGAFPAWALGHPVNILGLLYGGAMLVNFAWPRAGEQP